MYESYGSYDKGSRRDIQEKWRWVFPETLKKWEGPWSLHISWNTKVWEDFFTTDTFLEQKAQMKFTLANILTRNIK